MGVLGLGFAAAYVQHGFLPGADVAFPLAGVRVPIWHLIWMGFWAGYTMAIVGEAAVQILPTIDFVHRLVNDQLLQDRRRCAPIDSLELQEAPVEPRRE